jgi:lipopolysaccharide/colanic/teichoic acid biosynthesis glycosyltransferase
MRRKGPRVAFERLVDLGCAAIGLLSLAPLFVALSAAILWDDGPPILFGQTRVGRSGKLFTIWKFRTMRVGIPGRAITAAGDHRVTRLGAWLRAFKLDELPQLFNVLKGDMSLIGPRPEVPEYVRFDSPLWRAILQVRPGITDLATLIHRDEEQILGAFEDPNAAYREKVLPAKLYLNIVYLRSRSFQRDLKLIFLTIRYALFPNRFDSDYICKVFDIGAGANERNYLHPLSCSLDR